MLSDKQISFIIFILVVRLCYKIASLIIDLWKKGIRITDMNFYGYTIQWRNPYADRAN